MRENRLRTLWKSGGAVATGWLRETGNRGFLAGRESYAAADVIATPAAVFDASGKPLHANAAFATRLFPRIEARALASKAPWRSTTRARVPVPPPSTPAT